MKKHITPAATATNNGQAPSPPDALVPEAPTVVADSSPAAAGLQARLVRLQQERADMESTLNTFRQAADEANRRSAAATSARDDLQAQCAAMAQNPAGPPAPFDKLGQAMVAAVAAFDAAQAAQRAYDAAQEAAGDRSGALDREIHQVTQQLRRAELAALVAEYERRVRNARLGQLSDQIRELARSASIALEAHSPLIDPEHTVLTGYPVQAWA